MNKRFLKIAAPVLSSVVFGLLYAGSVYALPQLVNVDTNYVPLTTLPGVIQKGVATNPVAVIKGLYGLAIGVGSVIAVVMLIWAGFEYMYEESFGKKSDAKQRIQNAFIGLGVILASYILLRTINPALVNFDVTLSGGTGRVAALVAANQRLDQVLKDTQSALTDIKKFDDDLKALNTKSASLANSIDDLENQTELTDEQKAGLADLKAQLNAVNKDIQSKTIARANITTSSDTNLVLAKIDQNLIDLGPGGVATAEKQQKIVANIEVSQKGADDTYDKTLNQLKAFDQSDPTVKDAIAKTQARKDAMDAEFAEQKMINQIYNNAADWTKIVPLINSDVEKYSQQLTSAGLAADATALKDRANTRLAALCKQMNIGCSK